MRVVPMVLLALVLGTCGKQSRVIQLQETNYYFPAPHISAITDPKDNAGQYYIRLIPPGGYYWLVYDPRTHDQPNKQGRGVPTIAHINEWSVAFKGTPKGQEVKIVRNEAGAVLCRKYPVNDEAAALRQIFTCGFRVYDNGVAWSVIIPGDLVASAPALKRRAEITLADYRRMGAFEAAQ